MQQPKWKTTCGRVCSVAVLAAFASLANAAPAGLDTGLASAIRNVDAEPMALPADARAALAQPVTVAAAPAPARIDGMDFGQAADLGKLEQSRGGTDTSNVSNWTQLNGAVTNNSATNVVTGNNTIDAGSFANMAGIPTVIQNSGANVLIQSSTTVNLQFK
jgi:hypothetical protein